MKGDTLNSADPRSQLDRFDEAERARILTTLLCRDSDSIPKVDRAGSVIAHDGLPVQVMHNGVIVVADSYCGPWMTEIIRLMRGHHEPQEELVFHAIIDRLRTDANSAPIMIELGSWWAYYSLWFLRELPLGRAVALEPDPDYLEVGRRNAHLNNAHDRVRFVHGAIGPSPGDYIRFPSQSDDESYEVVQHDLHSLMAHTEIERADVVLADIQGAESILLDRAAGDFLRDAVRFLLVSTHHHSISGDPLTHQNGLRCLLESGAHVIAEHSVPESFSGDGLIAVSFDRADQDLCVELSHARARESIFGELEIDLAAASQHNYRLQSRADALESEANRLRRDNSLLRAERDAALAELAATRSTRLWRWGQPARSMYARARRFRT